jgi:ABC-type multidrug transport system fused ATPase/permease subunit
MSTDRSVQDLADDLGGETPIKPGQQSSSSQVGKLPLLTDQVSDEELKLKLSTAWTDYMVNGFKNAEAMFQQTLKAYMRPYYITVAMYVVIFIVGIGFFVAAAAVGIFSDKPVVAVAFGGLSVASFLMFFIRHPLQALEENLEFITWLGVAFNTYWARLMYLVDEDSIQADLKATADDYGNTIERLIDKHASMRAKRSGGELSPLQPAGSQTNTNPPASQGQTTSDEPAGTTQPTPTASEGLAS